MRLGLPLPPGSPLSPPRSPEAPLALSPLPFQAQATCPRIYTNALSNRCPCRARLIDLRWGPRGPHAAQLP